MFAKLAIACLLRVCLASTCRNGASTCANEEVESMLAIRAASEAEAEAEADAVHKEEGSLFPQWKIKEFFLREKKKMSAIALRRLSQTQKNCAIKRGRQRVLVAAGPRTGSTSLLTLANTLLYFCDANFEPVQESHPFADAGKDFPWEKFAGKRSSALKVHEPKDKMAKQYPTIVFTAHRKPDSQLASTWSHWYRSQSCKTPPCKSWTTAQRELERQACLYETFGHRIKYDMSLETLAGDTKLVIKEAAVAMGLDMSDELVQHVQNIYDQARKSITVSDQKRENVFIQTDAGEDEGEIDELGVATAAFHKSVTYSVEYGTQTVELKQWLDGNGTIASNPLWSTTAYKMNQDIKKFTDWDWCRGWKSLSSH